MPLDPSDIRLFREKFQLTQAAVAELVGVDPNTLARWERGEVPAPEPAGRLIRLVGLITEEEGETGSDPLSSTELFGSVFAPLSGYMAGRSTRRKARAALHLLHIRGWRSP